MKNSIFVACLGLPLLAGCAQSTGTDAPSARATPLASVSTMGSDEANPADPYLVVAPDGTPFLSWTEDDPQEEGRNALVVALDAKGRPAGKPRRMNDQPGEISGHGGENLAKFTVAADGTVVGSWMKPQPEYHTGDQRTAYAPPGADFSRAVTLNDDGKTINHAFSTITTSPDGTIYAAWIDGRNRTDFEDDRQQIYMARSNDGGRSFSQNSLVTGAVCPCCRPDFVFLDGGATTVISHRSVSKPENVRNHVVVRSTDGGTTFSDPFVISDDGWVSAGCPHAGISITGDRQNRIHAVWWTGGRTPEEAGIYYTVSEDGGQSFAPRQRIAEVQTGKVLHTQVFADSNGNLYAAWENMQQERPQIFLAVREQASGQWSKVQRVSDGNGNATFPMVAVAGNRLYLAWTERREESSRVKLWTQALAGS